LLWRTLWVCQTSSFGRCAGLISGFRGDLHRRRTPQIPGFGRSGRRNRFDETREEDNQSRKTFCGRWRRPGEGGRRTPCLTREYPGKTRATGAVDAPSPPSQHSPAGRLSIDSVHERKQICRFDETILEIISTRPSRPIATHCPPTKASDEHGAKHGIMPQYFQSAVVDHIPYHTLIFLAAANYS